jgi:hypothetical protein
MDSRDPGGCLVKRAGQHTNIPAPLTGTMMKRVALLFKESVDNWWVLFIIDSLLANTASIIACFYYSIDRVDDRQ